MIRTRLAVASRNLEQISRLSETVARQERQVGELMKMPDELRESWSSNVWQHFDPLWEMVRDNDDQLTEAAHQLRSGLEAFSASIKKAEDKAAQLRSHLIPKLYERSDLRDFLVRRAPELRERLNEGNYWGERWACDKVFAEYVDVLRAIALRSAGFGDEELTIGEFFRIADELPKVWGQVGGYRWQSLAIPALLEESTSTGAFTLHIGFPEWTIWALPLLQHEFGHIYVEKQLGRVVEADGRKFLAVMLADALACLVTGPAYGCAAVLMRLDPGAVGAPEQDPKGAAVASEVALRSASILATLKAVAGETGDQTTPVGQIARRLEREWVWAIDQAGGDTDWFQQAMSSDQCQTVVRQALAQRQLLGEENGTGPQPRWLQLWGTINTLADTLVNMASKSPGDDEQPMEDLDLRGVDGDYQQPFSLVMLLNAAWLARVRPDGKHDAVPDVVEEIGNLTARQLLDEVAGDRGPEGVVATSGGARPGYQAGFRR